MVWVGSGGGNWLVGGVMWWLVVVGCAVVVLLREQGSGCEHGEQSSPQHVEGNEIARPCAEAPAVRGGHTKKSTGSDLTHRRWPDTPRLQSVSPDRRERREKRVSTKERSSKKIQDEPRFAHPLSTRTVPERSRIAGPVKNKYMKLYTRCRVPRGAFTIGQQHRARVMWSLSLSLSLSLCLCSGLCRNCAACVRVGAVLM